MIYLRALPVLLSILVLACNSPRSSPETPAEGSPERDEPEEQAPLPAAATEADPRESMLAQTIADVLETQHLRDRELDEELSREAFSEYIENIDPGKLFLLEEHVETMRAYEDRMAEVLREGDLRVARSVSTLMEERRGEVLSVIESHLEDPFDFTVEETLVIDPEERSFSTSEDELAERWRRLLKLQVLERIERMESLSEALADTEEAEDSEDGEDPEDPEDPEAPEHVGTTLDDIPEEFEEREAEARDELLSHYRGRFERLSDAAPLEPAQRFFNAIASAYDPHTVYMPPADRENFDISMSGQLEGIGAQLQEDDHYIRVQEIVPGGAAWRQGELEAGDLIVAVAQEGEEPVDVADMRIDRVVQMIRGPKGSVVTLTVRKPDDTIEVVSITRDVVQIEDSYARGALLDLGEDHEAMGYIRLPSFYGDTRSRPGQAAKRRASEDIGRLLAMFEKRNSSGVILDLRQNGGGLLEHARDITGMFIEGGPVVKTKTSSGESQVLHDRDPEVAFRGEVVVLVDRFSASASEILAGALQDYERALVVGTSATHGKGTVQMMLDLDRVRRSDAGELGAFKLTVQQYFRVNGDSTQSRGVVPDIELPDPSAHIESGERYLDNAIPWSAVEPLDHDRWPHSWDEETIVSRSEKRQDERSIFKDIEAHSALLKARNERTHVPLAREAWKAQREQDRLMLESVAPELEEGSARFAVEAVEYRDKPDIEPRGGADKGDGGDGGDGDDSRGNRDSWQRELARDPWVEESLYVLSDMTASGDETTSSSR